jgi:hypothetical protein
MLTLAKAQNSSIEWPQRVDVELVFPRNTTYRPQPVFPVIFAIHNPAIIWPFHFNFTYDLDIWSTAETRVRAYSGGFNGMHTPTNLPLPSDIGNPMMVINATHALNNMTDGHATLNWTIGYATACKELNEEDGFVSELALRGSIGFTISNSTDIALDPLNSTSGCSKHIGSFDVQGQIPVLDTSPPWSCPFVVKASEKEGCGMAIDNALAKRVLDVMFSGTASAVACRWPHPTAVTLDQMCSKSEQPGQSTQPGQSAASSHTVSRALVVIMSLFCAVMLL